jgi:YVTN family beta-propeller protein
MHRYLRPVACAILTCFAPSSALSEQPVSEPDRSPVALALTPDGAWLVTANATSHTVALIQVESGKVVDEVACGRRPTYVTLTPDGRRALVTAADSGELTIFEREGPRLTRLAAVKLGFEPRGLAVTADGRIAYVALSTAGEVAVVDLEKRLVVERIAVGRWPRYVALSPDGHRLAVGLSGDGGVAVVDTVSRKKLFSEDFAGLNFGEMQVSSDGKYAYVPWMVYRHNPITQANIRQGWVLASRIARIRLDAPARREAISLDPQGQAISDPHGLALSPDQQWLVCSASGTHELLVYRLGGLPWQDYGGPGDHIDPQLLKAPDRFYRIPLGGRPMGVRFSKDGRRVYVANALQNAVQVVDLASRKVERTMALGGPREPSLARRGEAIFYDGRRSLDQWYSCHSCHYEGHTNAVTMDTRNDGRNGNFKVVLSLRNVTHTGPWTWHGWQKDLHAAMRKSLTDTMLPSQDPTDDEVRALSAFLETLTSPPNPHRQLPAKGDDVRRGEQVFRSGKANCSRCHSGPYFTDGKIHDVGTATPGDVYEGYNTPSLIGVFDRMLYLHDGRAKSLEQVLTGSHNPDRVTGRGELTADELRDLLAYLRSL